MSTRAEAEQRLDEIFHFNHRSEHHSSRGGGKNAGAPSAAHTAMLEERARVERSLVGGGLSGRSASRRPVKDRMSSKAPFLNRVKERIGSKERVKDVRLGDDDTSLRGMVRVDEWGALMRGQEHTMNNVHTPSLPGGYLWGDIMLYECVTSLRAVAAAEQETDGFPPFAQAPTRRCAGTPARQDVRSPALLGALYFSVAAHRGHFLPWHGHPCVTPPCCSTRM